MKERTDPKSPWGKRLVYEDSEFEAMAEEALERADASVFAPGEGVDIEKILNRVGIEPDYVEMDSGMLGRARFARDGSVAIEIARTLSERAETDPVQRRRLRATMAHECGHVACHRVLWLDDAATGLLFSLEKLRPPIMCRADDIERGSRTEHGYDGRWWEYQANRFMAAVLLPRAVLRLHVDATLKSRGHSDVATVVNSPGGARFTSALAEIFDVNPVMVTLRLHQLGWTTRDRSQTTLAFP